MGKRIILLAAVVGVLLFSATGAGAATYKGVTETFQSYRFRVG